MNGRTDCDYPAIDTLARQMRLTHRYEMANTGRNQRPWGHAKADAASPGREL